MPVCKACYNRCAVGKNFGAETCASCAAFFRRTVRLKIVYPCKNDFYSCRKDAVRFVSAVHACRKCRFDRCIELGMNPGLVQNPRPNQSKLSLMPKEVVHSFSTQFPLISSMTNVLRATLLDRCITSDARLTIGTSEPASNFLSYNVYRRLTLCEVKKYREMLDYSPVVCELNKDVKDAIFRNSFALALIVVQVHFNLKHRSLGFENKKKIYIFPNVYFDLDPEKLLFFFASHKNPQSLAGMNDCLAIARQLSRNLQFLQEIGLQSNAFYGTYEDIAALTLVAIIQSNDVPKGNMEWQRPMRRLKAVWNEVDLYYRMTQRDPSQWGNLLFLLSNMQTFIQNHEKFRKLLNVYYGKTMMDKIESGQRPEETIAQLMLECTAN